MTSARTFIIVLATIGVAHSASAAISYFNHLANNPNDFEVGRWSRSTTIKTYDLDGDNVYGSDGYVLMNTSNAGSLVGVLASSLESAPSYTTAISYTGAGAGASGSFNGAENVLNPGATAAVNLGYAGYTGPAGAAIPLQELFTYTMNRDMTGGETIRLGIITDSLSGELRVGITELRVVAGGLSADATVGAWNRTAGVDMYFFDITGLSNGDEIEIWGANSNTAGANFNLATIGAVTFDSVPELSTAALLGLGCLAWFRRRSR